MKDPVAHETLRQIEKIVTDDVGRGMSRCEIFYSGSVAPPKVD